ncbi:DUF3152 domain-containing protein [Streptomyces alfalfae]|uniref:DUF3152 domain-containing protein n=1 Tax=Streptomyces alfalfae TaxID=1642299 RepID=A0A7T4PJ94_9ACTN|nr:DUF3152 domain-containing protein [Streptomyces alfalfae]QQC91252.1 DUF3152 domain-containing protein [Streptomyces alfalfae]
MGRHSRRGPADTTDETGASGAAPARAAVPRPGPGSGRRRRAPGDEGTPAHGTPAASYGTPAHGTHIPPHGTPPHGVPHARGGHPEQREDGGGWGEVGGTGAGPRADAAHPAPPPAMPGPRGQGPRQDYVAAFAEGDAPASSGPPPPRDLYASVTAWGDVEPRPGDEVSFAGDGDLGDGSDEGVGRRRRNRRAYAGIAAAAVTTVLAVVVAGQVADGADPDDTGKRAAAGGGDRDTEDPASRSDERNKPAKAPDAPPVTYEQKMGEKYPLDAKLSASGEFEAVGGFAKGPGKGQRFRYRVDVEKGLGLDGPLFADAVQKTLNDERSWAHKGARTFERIESGKPDFVITLASPTTTAKWCAKSGLDTTQDNVSCDSAATERVMINAYRWAQGAKTYGDDIYPYRQMLINHEVGHRLGFNHTDCSKSGDLAPVMQQQTKFLDHDGIKCKANPWAFPKS